MNQELSESSIAFQENAKILKGFSFIISRINFRLSYNRANFIKYKYCLSKCCVQHLTACGKCLFPNGDTCTRHK